MLLLPLLLFFFFFCCCCRYTDYCNRYDCGSLPSEDGVVAANTTVEYKYLLALYWSVQTMTTVGYGDLTPSTTSEYVIAMAAQFVGCAVFGYIISKIANVVEGQAETQRNRREKTDQLTHFITTATSLTPGTKRKVKRFFNYYWDKQVIGAWDCLPVCSLNCLPCSL